MYPQWDVLQHSMDLPRHGEKEPALAIVDGESVTESVSDVIRR